MGAKTWLYFEFMVLTEMKADVLLQDTVASVISCTMSSFRTSNKSRKKKVISLLLMFACIKECSVWCGLVNISLVSE